MTKSAVSRQSFLTRGTSSSDSKAVFFDTLEAFLAAWARISLLFFPTANNAFARERGHTLERIFELDEASLLANRALRNSWTHHDEHIDRLVTTGRFGAAQLFRLSSQVTEQDRETCLRIIEIDTLKVHYHDRAGIPQTVSLHELRQLLEDLDDRRASAFDRLAMPPENDT